MSYRYRLLCIDVDGTLLDSNKELPQRNIDAIKKAYDTGVQIAIASGRSPWSVQELLDEIGIDGCGICMNGSYVVDRGREIFKHTMDNHEIEKILNVVIKYNVTAFFTTSEVNITNETCDFDDNKFDSGKSECNACSGETEVNNKKKSDLRESEMKNSYIRKSVVNSKKYIVCSNSQFKNELRKYFGSILKVSIREEDEVVYQKVREELESLNLFEVQKSDVDYLDINSKGINKFTGVKKLAEYFKFDLSEVACIGDNENDIDMIKNSGLGIAMANACKGLLNISDKVSLSNDECGVAEAITKFIFNFNEYPHW